MAKLAKYLTIIGMLTTVAWFFWNPNGWEFDWEPLVVFIFAFAGFVAADSNSVTGKKPEKVKQSHPNDVLLAKQLLEALPTNGVMSFLKGHDFLGSFKSDSIEKMGLFAFEWSSPEHEFIDTELEALRKELLDGIVKFNHCVAIYTSPNSRGLQAVKYDKYSYDADQEQRFVEEAKKINQAADLVVELHAAFVRTAREKLDLT